MPLKLQGVVHLPQLFLTHAQIAPRHHRSTMIVDFGQLNQSHFSIRACHFHDPTTKCLSKAMGTEVLNLYLVTNLEVLEVPICHLDGQDRAETGEETGLCIIFYPQRIVAILNMLLKAFVDANFPSFSSLLFAQNKTIGC